MFINQPLFRNFVAIPSKFEFVDQNKGLSFIASPLSKQINPKLTDRSIINFYILSKQKIG